MIKCIFLSLLILGACKNSKPAITEQHLTHKAKELPRVVKSKCGQWAIQTRDCETYILYFGRQVTAYYSEPFKGKEFLLDGDVSVGREYQYKDSISAATAYNTWKYKTDSVDAKIKTRDSIIKCQHTYE